MLNIENAPENKLFLGAVPILGMALGHWAWSRVTQTEYFRKNKFFLVKSVKMART